MGDYDDQWMFREWSDEADMTLWDFVCMMIGYFVWQVFYWIKVELMDKKKLKENKDLVTSAVLPFSLLL